MRLAPGGWLGYVEPNPMPVIKAQHSSLLVLLHSMGQGLRGNTDSRIILPRIEN
jgi:hypothetical protein